LQSAIEDDETEEEEEEEEEEVRSSSVSGATAAARAANGAEESRWLRESGSVAHFNSFVCSAIGLVAFVGFTTLPIFLCGWKPTAIRTLARID
jgi:hypothetical protein